MKISIVIILIIGSFLLGSKFGRWDVIHGAKFGERWGEATKGFIDAVIENGEGEQ